MAESAKKKLGAVPGLEAVPGLKALPRQPAVNPELIRDMDFFQNLGMMEMIVDMGIDRKMKPAVNGKATEKASEEKKR